MTDEEVLAGCRVTHPALFRHGLSPEPTDGAGTKAKMAEVVQRTRSILLAAEAVRSQPKA